MEIATGNAEATTRKRQPYSYKHTHIFRASWFHGGLALRSAIYSLIVKKSLPLCHRFNKIANDFLRAKMLCKKTILLNIINFTRSIP